MKALLLILVSIAVFIVGVTIFIAPNSLMKCGQSPSSAEECDKADAIVAVSGGDTYQRTQEAINLYKNGWGDVLIFSGAASDTSGPSNAESMRDQAINQGVPVEDIRIEILSENTHENAAYTSSILSQEKLRNVILVTSQYHSKRVKLEFEKSAQDVEFRVHPTDKDGRWSYFWWLNPKGWYLTIGEFVKILVFYIEN